MRLLAVLMMLATAAAAGSAREARVRGGREARVLESADAAAGLPAPGRVLSITANLGNKACTHDANDATLATRAGVNALAQGAPYPYTIVVISTQEGDKAATDEAWMASIAAALRVPAHEGAGATWVMVNQDKGSGSKVTRQRIYYDNAAVSGAGADHGKFIGQADYRFFAKNYLLRTLNIAPLGGQVSTCTLDIVSTHLPMDSGEKSGLRTGLGDRLAEIAALQTWRTEVLHSAGGAAILSGA